MKKIIFSGILITTIQLIYQSKYLFGGDSAEFPLIAHTWSIAHPPGYPLYSLLLNLTRIFLFFLPEYIRYNFWSIIPSIITYIILYYLLNMLINNQLISLFASTFYTILFPFWLYSEVPEVFAFNNLIIVLITYLLIYYLKQPSVFIKHILFFLSGLIIAHHHIAFIIIPGWYVLLKKKIKPFFQDLYPSIIFFLLGFSFYLYAPIASYFNPPLDYENPKTLDGFIRLITRASYGTFRAYVGATTNFLSQFYNAFSIFIYLIHDFRLIGLFLIMIGIIYLKKSNNIIFRFVLVSIIFEVFFIFYTSFMTTSTFIQAISERFLIPIYLLLTIPYAYGLKFCFLKINELKEKYIKHPLLSKLVIASIWLFLISYFGIVFYSNWSAISYLPRADQFDTLAKNILSTPPAGSILCTGSDTTTFTSYYYYYVKKFRSDLKIVHLGLLPRKYYQEKLKSHHPELNLRLNPENVVNDFIQKNQRFGIYLENPVAEGAWAPYGLLWKYYPTKDNADKDLSQLVPINRQLWNEVYQIPKYPTRANNILHLKSVRDHYIGRYVIYVRLLINNKKKSEAEQNLLKIINHYDRNNILVLKEIIKLYSSDGQCQIVKPYKDRFDKQFDNTSLEDLAVMITYYNNCDKNNNRLNIIIDNYKKIESYDKLPLKNL